MAQWKETLEPYIKVHESIKTTTLNPTAGESLIIGVTLISDAGSSNPTLITSQSDFINTYASRDLSKEYIESLNDLYEGDDSTLASTMWCNAYRLAGSNTLLITRASKATDIYFSKPITTKNNYTYLLRDGELLRKTTGKFKIVIDEALDEAIRSSDGWSISINGVGVFGNRTTDSGVQYDYFVNSLPELVDNLNNTSKFFSPEFRFFKDVEGIEEVFIDSDSTEEAKKSVKSVIFDEVYLGSYILDKTDPRVSPDFGYTYMVICEPDWSSTVQTTIDLNTGAWSGFEADEYYATNVYNSATDLRVRIRRFNHDAVVSKSITDTASLTENGQSPYTVLTDVLDTFTSRGSKTPGENVLYRDFFEVAIFDPSVNSEVSFFTVGNIPGRGDMEVSEINGLLNMIQLTLPDDLHELGLNYYSYGKNSETPEEVKDNTIWKKVTDKARFTMWDSTNSDPTAPGVTVEIVESLPRNPEVNPNKYYRIEEIESTTYWRYSEEGWEELMETPESYKAEVINELPTDGMEVGDIYKLITKKYTWWRFIYKDNFLEEVQLFSDLPKLKYSSAGDNDNPGVVYKVISEDSYYEYFKNGTDNLYLDLTIDPTKYSILKVTNTELKKALDLIALDEIYTTEGLCDLGNTDLSFQNYMANMAINENYFYPISTLNSTNYMTIGNGITKISQDSCKLYASSPWDIDSGTMGWKYYASPSVLFWEAVARNRRNNNEFASIFGQSCGVVQYQRPVTEFNKKSRQLLLSRKVNTVLWNVSTQAWNMNDSYTKQSEDNILGEDGNSRLCIRISKAMPTLLRQFIGKKITEKLCKDVENVINYFFTTTIYPMNYTVSEHLVTCKYDENLARQHKIKVRVQTKMSNSLRFIDVYNDVLEIGMEFED